MAIQIVGSFDKDQIYCTGSFTKLLTTFVSLSLLAETYDLKQILDDDYFLDKISTQANSKNFLKLFQNIIGSRFTIRDLCSHYAGLPYTFEPAEKELEQVDLGQAFKHHSIIDEDTFLFMCHNKITRVYEKRCKFHYSELSIIFLGYLLEKIYAIDMESLYEKYVIKQFNLQNSIFSRTLINGAYYQDLSDQYDYPSIAKLNHGYFCYSNGFYTTQSDTKILLENLIANTIFNQFMIDINHARAASNKIMNGLSVEIRKVNDDIVIGYEGLSFSGCNIWAYSSKYKKGYLTFTEDEEAAYPIIYDQFGYTEFDPVPEHTQIIYRNFIKNYQYNYRIKTIPSESQGEYQRVKINEKVLKKIFHTGEDFIVIRNPEDIHYEVIFFENNYRIKGKDNVHGSRVGFYRAKSGRQYLFYDGNLYKHVAEK